MQNVTHIAIRWNPEMSEYRYAPVSGNTPNEDYAGYTDCRADALASAADMARRYSVEVRGDSRMPKRCRCHVCADARAAAKEAVALAPYKAAVAEWERTCRRYDALTDPDMQQRAALRALAVVQAALALKREDLLFDHNALTGCARTARHNYEVAAAAYAAAREQARLCGKAHTYAAMDARERLHSEMCDAASQHRFQIVRAASYRNALALRAGEQLTTSVVVTTHNTSHGYRICVNDCAEHELTCAVSVRETAQHLAEKYNGTLYPFAVLPETCACHKCEMARVRSLAEEAEAHQPSPLDEWRDACRAAQAGRGYHAALDACTALRQAAEDAEPLAIESEDSLEVAHQIASQIEMDYYYDRKREITPESQAKLRALERDTLYAFTAWRSAVKAREARYEAATRTVERLTVALDGATEFWPGALLSELAAAQDAQRANRPSWMPHHSIIGE